MFRVAVFVGSLRKESINLRYAKALAKLRPEKLDCTIVGLHDLPMYNEDLWENVPEAVTNLKKAVEFSDAVLFVTPEYNRSFSPVIKNAIDWGTRPYGNNSWKGKPAAITGATTGAIGTAVAQGHLRSIVPILEMPLMGQPEAYLTFKEEAFGHDGEINDARTKEFLTKFVDAFIVWIEKHKAS